MASLYTLAHVMGGALRVNAEVCLGSATWNFTYTHTECLYVRLCACELTLHTSLTPKRRPHSNGWPQTSARPGRRGISGGGLTYYKMYFIFIDWQNLYVFSCHISALCELHGRSRNGTMESPLSELRLCADSHEHHHMHISFGWGCGCVG